MPDTRPYPAIKRDKVCPTCKVVLKRLDEHVERCAKAPAADREYFVKFNRWPPLNPERSHIRDPDRLVGAQDDWLQAATQAGVEGVRKTMYDVRAKKGLIKRGLLEERDNRVYVTEAGKVLWAKHKKKGSN